MIIKIIFRKNSFGTAMKEKQKEMLVVPNQAIDGAFRS